MFSFSSIFKNRSTLFFCQHQVSAKNLMLAGNSPLFQVTILPPISSVAASSSNLACAMSHRKASALEYVLFSFHSQWLKRLRLIGKKLLSFSSFLLTSKLFFKFSYFFIIVPCQGINVFTTLFPLIPISAASVFYHIPICHPVYAHELIKFYMVFLFIHYFP